MNYNLSGIDLHFIVDELNLLQGAKVDKIFQPQKEEFIFRFHKSGIGKLMLRVVLPNLIYLSSFKKEMQDHPKGFCMYLRKNLTNSRVISLTQISLERIVKIVFETKEENLVLYIELFGKGNVILCDKDDIILSASIARKWTDRSILPKEKYVMPPSRLSIYELEEEKMVQILNQSDKSYVKTLALDFGMGGKYAEEICTLSNVRPKEKPDEEGINKIIETIKYFKKRPLSPLIISQENKFIDIIPFPLERYNNNNNNNLTSLSLSSLNEALDKVFAESQQTESLAKHTTKYEKNILQAENIIKTQEEQVCRFQVQIESNQEKGESIYNNYSFLSELILEISKASEKMSWEDIKTRVEDHPKVLSFDTKTKKIKLNL